MSIKTQIFGLRAGPYVNNDYLGIDFTLSSKTSHGGFGLMGRIPAAPFNGIFPDGLASPISPYAPNWGSNLLCSDAAVGVGYKDQWDIVGVGVPTTYSLLAGTLPPGLVLSSLTGNIGKLQGTPTTPGSYTFTLRATNAYGTADQAFTVVVVTPSGGGGGAWTFIS